MLIGSSICGYLIPLESKLRTFVAVIVFTVIFFPLIVVFAHKYESTLEYKPQSQVCRFLVLLQLTTGIFSLALLSSINTLLIGSVNFLYPWKLYLFLLFIYMLCMSYFRKYSHLSTLSPPDNEPLNDQTANGIQVGYLLLIFITIFFLNSLINKNILFILLFCSLLLVIYLNIVNKRQYMKKVSIAIVLLSLACILIPCDVAIRPSKTFAIRVLPIETNMGAAEHIRKLVSHGKEENIDFVVYHGGGLKHQYSLVLTYPSSFTSVYHNSSDD